MKLFDAVNSPEVLRRFHGWATIVWFIVSFPLAITLGSSVVFVTFLSLYAVVTGHWSSWQAARVEVNQDNEIDLDILCETCKSAVHDRTYSNGKAQ